MIRDHSHHHSSLAFQQGLRGKGRCSQRKGHELDRSTCMCIAKPSWLSAVSPATPPVLHPKPPARPQAHHSMSSVTPVHELYALPTLILSCLLLSSPTRPSTKSFSFSVKPSLTSKGNLNTPSPLFLLCLVHTPLQQPSLMCHCQFTCPCPI